MPKRIVWCALVVACGLISHPHAFAGDHAGTPAAESPRQALVFGLGGAADFDFGQGDSSFGVNVFVEYMLMRDHLEVEFGASSLALKRGRELAYNLFFKTPVWNSHDADISIAGGPELVQFTGTRNAGNFPGVGIAMDVMYWPAEHFGFYVEPAYEVVFRRATETALDLNAGMLVAW